MAGDEVNVLHHECRMFHFTKAQWLTSEITAHQQLNCVLGRWSEWLSKAVLILLYGLLVLNCLGTDFAAPSGRRFTVMTETCRCLFSLTNSQSRIRGDSVIITIPHSSYDIIAIYNILQHGEFLNNNAATSHPFSNNALKVQFCSYPFYPD